MQGQKQCKVKMLRPKCRGKKMQMQKMQSEKIKQTSDSFINDIGEIKLMLCIGDTSCMWHVPTFAKNF